jgi:ribulose 1,5-bisphosphate carboxylase large subunit-like protein
MGEWADRADMRRCRLVDVEWPEWLPGPAFEAHPGVVVGAIVKPSLGLSPQEAALTAESLTRGGARLVKDDELVTPASDERIRAIASALPDGVVYTANVTGAHETLLERAEQAIAAGATGLMLNAFVQGLDALRALREASLGVPLFAHRVGAAFLARGGAVSVAPELIAAVTRTCGADYVQVGSFEPRVHDSDDEVRAEIQAARPATAVIGGGVGPQNAREQLDRAATREGVMLLLGSAAYTHPEGVEAGVRATVEAIAG